jgi:hypothetical protein
MGGFIILKNMQQFYCQSILINCQKCLWKALEKNIENLRNRDDYRCFAKDLKFLAKNLTAFEKASELREKWLVEYKKKSALCEELRWAF